MDREFIKAIIEELGAAALEAVAGKKFATLALKFAISIMTKDFVLDKLLGLFGSNPATFQANLTAHVAARGALAAAPESIDELEAKFAADVAA